jgi:hypothetical protein
MYYTNGAYAPGWAARESCEERREMASCILVGSVGKSNYYKKGKER